MKNCILFALFALLTAGSLKAQSLLLFKGEDPIGNGSEINVVNAPDHDPVELSLIVSNPTANGMEVKVKRTDLSLVNGTSANFCWGTACYPPFVYESPESVRIDAGTSNSSFRGDYTHGGNLGTSRVLFTFFDSGNPADSTWIVVNYVIANIASQSFEVTYNGGLLSNDQQISVLYEPSHDPVEVMADVKNINTVPVSVRVKKYDYKLLENTSANICWGPSCYPPFVYDTPEAVIIESGATDNTFRGDYTHGGVQGTSVIRYTFYNTENPSDSLSFLVSYTIGYVGVDDVVVTDPEISNAYPNPASSTVGFDYVLPQSSEKATIRVTNLLGTIIDVITLDKTSGKATLDVSNLKNGIYFYSLMINNSAKYTRKFVVKR